MTPKPTRSVKILQREVAIALQCGRPCVIHPETLNWLLGIAAVAGQVSLGWDKLKGKGKRRK